MDELIADFISETSESLLDLDNELVELENNPDNDELLGKIFRVMHTIKGTCGFLELNKLASIGHAGENILYQSPLITGQIIYITNTPHNL